MTSDGGKGSAPRPFSVSQEEFDNRYEAIFDRKVKTQGIPKCGCGKTKDPNGGCDGSHGMITNELESKYD